MPNPVVIHSSVDTDTDYTFEVRGFDGDGEMEVTIVNPKGVSEVTWLSRRQADSLYKAIAHELGDI